MNFTRLITLYHRFTATCLSLLDEPYCCNRFLAPSRNRTRLDLKQIGRRRRRGEQEFHLQESSFATPGQCVRARCLIDSLDREPSTIAPAVSSRLRYRITRRALMANCVIPRCSHNFSGRVFDCASAWTENLSGGGGIMAGEEGCAVVASGQVMMTQILAHAEEVNGVEYGTSSCRFA
jgi:hypothetical protein